MTPREGMALASKHFGSDKALAEAIGFSQAAFYRAKQLGWPTPEMACNIEAATMGRVTRAILRPDVFGDHPQLIRNAWRGRKRLRFSASSRRKPL